MAAGGASRMNSVGSMRAGNMPCTAMRTSSSTSTTGQNSSPMPNCAADHSAWPSGTPASGASTLPTTGMTSAGVTPAHCNPPAVLPRHQRASTHTVTNSCARLPTHHSPAAQALGPNCATATVASSSSAIGSVATKAWRTGWRRSSAQASGCRVARISVATASATNAAAASAPTPIDTLSAIGPMAGTALFQASDNPHRPMTMAYQLGNRNFSGVG